MPVKTFRPLTPSTRYISIASYDEITKTKPEKMVIKKFDPVARKHVDYKEAKIK